MTYIQVKGINDYLLFMLNDEVDFQLCLDELQQLLSSPSFQKDHFYVKGYFDFGSRQLTKTLFKDLMGVLDKTRNVLFCGTHQIETKKHELAHLKGIIRNGEVLVSHEDVLFEGKINPGGKLVVHGRAFVLGSCQGTIEAIGKNAYISVANLKHANLVINEKRREDMCIDRLTSFYDNGKTIGEVEELWQEQL